MKRGWKIFWIVCAVLAAAGIFLIGAGTVLGGFGVLSHNEAGESIVESWMKRLGAAHTVQVQKISDDEDISYMPEEVDGTLVSAHGQPEELEIEVDAAMVTIRPYDGEELLVDISGLRPDLQDRTEVKDSRKQVEVTLKVPGWKNTNDVGEIYINVPRKAVPGRIQASMKAGYLEAEKISVSELSVELGAGQAVLTDFSAETLEADCGTGQIILDGEVVKGAELKCGMGEMICTFPGQQETYDYEVSCSMGEVTIGEETYSGLSKKIRQKNGSGCKIEADCGMGRIEIGFR